MKAVDDVRKEVSRRNIENGQFARSSMLSATGDMSKLYSRTPGALPIEDFAQEERERTLELLLSQERVINLLYTKTFPIVPPSNLIPSNSTLVNNYTAHHAKYSNKGITPPPPAGVNNNINNSINNNTLTNNNNAVELMNDDADSHGESNNNSNNNNSDSRPMTSGSGSVTDKTKKLPAINSAAKSRPVSREAGKK